MTPDRTPTPPRSHPVSRRTARRTAGGPRPLIWACAAAVAALLVACGGSHLASRWRDRTIAVDGDASDWDGVLQGVKEGGFQVGAENDGEYLYLCLRAPADERDARRLARGFTVWLDPSGGKEHALGVRFPPAFAGRWMARERGEGGAPPDTGEAAVDQVNDAIRVVHGGAEAATLGDLVGTAGVEARVGGRLAGRVYEVRIPLDADAGQGAGWRAAPGATIGLGLETTALRGRSGRGAGMRGGGFGPPGGEFGGRRGGGMGGPGWGGAGGKGPGGGRGIPEPITYWTKLTLARMGAASGT